MKQKLKQIAANYCVWYFLSVLLSVGIVVVLVLLWGDDMQDYMYLRHNAQMPSDWILLTAMALVSYHLRIVIEKGLVYFRKFLKLSKRKLS